MTSLSFPYSRKQSSQRLGNKVTPPFRPSRIYSCEVYLAYLGAYPFSPLSRRLFPPESMKPIMAVVFTQTTEHLVCLRFRSSASFVFVVFDAHSRPEHPFGPAFILASDVDAIATHFNQLLTQPSISKSASKQDITTNHSFTALVIESRNRPSTFDVQDLLAKSVAFLFVRLSTVDRTLSNLDLGTPVFGLEQLRVRETQTLVHAPHKQDSNRQTCRRRPLARRSEFGWQLNLQVSGTSSAVDSKNNSSAEPLEVKETSLDLPKKSQDAGPDGENTDIPRIIVSNADGENISDKPHSHLHSRTEFGWQLALQQQTSITGRRKLEEYLEIVASTVVSQGDIKTHRVVLGKGKEEASDVATQMLEGFTWEDILMKQLQEEEELVASSAGYLCQESAWVLALRKRLLAEEDKVNNPVASSSSSPYTKGITSTYLHEFDFKPLPSTEGESSTIHRHSFISPLFPYADPLEGSNRAFTTLELPTSEFSAESHECGVCNEVFGVPQVIQLPTCSHTFCRECLRTFTKTRINEGRYPIFCPVCAIERTRVNHSRELGPLSHFVWIG
jgi:hypothetical protein